MERTAIFSGPDNRYRNELRRVWDAGKPLLVVCMLNPSTADHLVDDPTILTLIHFGKLWGYGGLLIVNLFAFRSSSPAEMRKAADPSGPENPHFINAAIEYTAEASLPMLAAWGNVGAFEAAAVEWVHRRAETHSVSLACLGTTMHGHPKHPMARGKHRIPRDQLPLPFRRAP